MSNEPRFLLENEFATVWVARDDSANGPRLYVEDARTGRGIYLDPVELEWIAHSDRETFHQLMPEEFHVEQ